MTRTYLFACVAAFAATGCLQLIKKKSDGGTTTAKKAEPEEREAKAPDEASFPEAEQYLVKTSPVWAKNHGKPPPTVLRAYVMDEDWGMTRADNNVIVGRHTRAVLFYKGGETGRCYQILCNLRQEEQGGKWGKPYLQCINEYATRVTCDSIASLRQGAVTAQAGTP